MIWFALAIPVVTSVVLYLYFHRKVLWWEFAIPFAVSLIVILIINTMSFYSQTTDSEYLAFYVKEAVYTEEWNELVHYTTTTTDSKGKTTTHHHTRVDYHPAYWTFTLNNDSEVYTTKAKYEELKLRWGSKPKFVDMHRSYYTKDGDRYEVSYNGKKEHTETYNYSCMYTNRVKASNSVFKFKDMKGNKDLFPYPVICDDKVPSVLGVCKNKEAIDKFLQYENAHIGLSHQCRMYLLIFRNKSIQTAIDQEQLWYGGKRKDFVMGIGLDSEENVTWAYSFSWTEKEILKSTLNQYAMSIKKWDGMEFAKYYSDEVKRKFVPKNFSDFDYINVEPTAWAVIFTYVITLLTNLGVSFYVVNNQFKEE